MAARASRRSKSAAAPIVGTASELWERLCRDALLELQRERGEPGRDADLDSAVLDLLIAQEATLPRPSTVQSLLSNDALRATPSISVEKLLVAILTSQRDFSLMMDDIFEVLLDAKARRTDDVLGMVFCFDKADHSVRSTLEAFQATTTQVRQILAERRDTPSADQMWDLARVLNERVPADATSDCPDDFGALEPLPLTADGAVDRLLGQLMDLIAEVRAWGRNYTDDRREWWQASQAPLPMLADDPDELARWVAWRGLISDRWDRTLYSAASRIADDVIKGFLPGAHLVSMLTPLMASLPTRSVWVDQTYQKLLDLLNLPVWKHRHELYSVWVGTVLLRVARDHAQRFDYHVKEGALSFAFGGSRLATYDHQGQPYDIWAELRSELRGPSKKRKKGIQPDFRVVIPRMPPKLSEDTRLVVECKHYLTSRTANFSQAAADYARSCPAANVLVVNHGAALHDRLLAEVAAANADASARVRFIGDATAQAQRIRPDLYAVIRQALFGPTQAIQPTAASAPPKPPAPPEPLAPPEQRIVGRAYAGSIHLTWDASLRDVDLHLEAIDDKGDKVIVDFAHQGDFFFAPARALLLGDVQQGPGQEEIDILEWAYPSYRIFVHNYSGIGSLSAQSVSVRVICDRRWEALLHPQGEQFDPWEVATVDVVDGVPRLRASAGTRVSMNGR